jgi:CheY-like chemotaxis protein
VNNAEILILVVEDEAMILLGMEDALEGGGYTVLSASNGSDALRVLDDRHADLAGIITDIRLGPDATGWEIARHARALNSEIAVLFVSADSADDWAVEGVPKSVMLQKPFAEAQLITAISALITEARTPG